MKALIGGSEYPAELFLAILPAEQISKFCAVGAYTWFLYDYFITLPSEIQYVWVKSWGTSKALFLWMRYFGFTLLTVYMAVLFTPSHSEQLFSLLCLGGLWWISHAFHCGSGTPASHLCHVQQKQNISGSQPRVLYDGNHSHAYSLQHWDQVLATPPGITGCWGVTTSYLFSIWFPGLAFECWLAGLAVWKAIDRSRKGVMLNGQKVDLLSLLIRDSVIYFFLIAAGLASNAFLWLASTVGCYHVASSFNRANSMLSLLWTLPSFREQ
ncbi:hypothetical protein HD554DRAFT_1177377 [Boletus coccyginus]|nr:hypothetical protein HD554DRAFT_1177377 [Boletus coccyginus]